MKHHWHHLNFKKLSKFEMFVTAAGSIEPVMALPQVLKVYRLESATELFLWTWVFSFFVSLMWAIYGLKLKKLPITSAAVLWMAIHGSMAVAVLLYG